MARKLGIDKLETYDFTRRWFLNRNLETFREQVLPAWGGRPCVYLELGVFEGQSLVWMFQRVLTHPRSRAVGIDPWLMTTKLDEAFMDGVRLRAKKNVSEWRDRCTLVRANSAEALRRMCGRGGFVGLEKASVDVCMIDGDHNELAVLDDARHCLELVKSGGWLLFDDVENDHTKRRHVKQGLEMFLAEAGDKVRQIWKHGYVEAFERL